MLTTWLIELFLNELGGLRDEGDATAHHKLQQQFHKFLEIDGLRVSKLIYMYLSTLHLIISKLHVQVHVQVHVHVHVY
jgi:hypothetical protein